MMNVAENLTDTRCQGTISLRVLLRTDIFVLRVVRTNIEVFSTVTHHDADDDEARPCHSHSGESVALTSLVMVSRVQCASAR